MTRCSSHFCDEYLLEQYKENMLLILTICKGVSSKTSGEEFVGSTFFLPY